MEVYNLFYIGISVKNKLTYRWESITRIISSVLMILISVFLWKYLYNGSKEMLLYMTQYTVLSYTIGLFYTKGIAVSFGEKIRDGSLAIDLLRPVNIIALLWQKEFAEIIANFLMQGLPAICVFLFYLIKIQFGWNIILGCIAVILGHILYFLMFFLLGLCAIIATDIEFYNRIFNDTIQLLAGGFIPLALFPETLKCITEYLPFRFLYSFPIRLFLETDNVEWINFAILLFWIFIFLIGTIILYKKLLKKIIVLGG